MEKERINLSKEKDQERLIKHIYIIINKLINKKKYNIQLILNLYKSEIKEIKNFYEIEIIIIKFKSSKEGLKLYSYNERNLMIDNDTLNNRINNKEIEKDIEELIMMENKI